jgi:hypothetical protein
MRLFCLLFSLCFVLTAQAQSSNQNNLQKLATGTLIVILDDRKADGDKLWKDGDYKGSQMLMESAHVANLYFLDIIRQNYTFSKTLFVFKSDLAKLRSGQISRIFLTVDLTPDSTATIDGDNFCFLQQGSWVEGKVGTAPMLDNNKEWGAYAPSEKTAVKRSKYADAKPAAPTSVKNDALLLTNFDGEHIGLPCPSQFKIITKGKKTRLDKAIQELNLTLHEYFKAQ